MNFFEDLKAREIVKQMTDPELEPLLLKTQITLYCGFDPTSDSLHVGSLLPLLTLRRFQLAGHKPIAVVGGSTGMIGDPSFKSQERSLLTEEELAKNLAGITRVIKRFLSFEGPNAAVVVSNADWTKNLTYLEFLRDIGKHFTINHMMAKESVRARLEDREHGISYTEFSYMLLQAFDFHVLAEKHNCTLQIGGSDQWGNITAGCELIRRLRAAGEAKSTHDVFGMTHPLVMKADGTKFGKSESGNVWVDADKTSPYDFYQFYIQTSDADVIRYLKYFTFLSIEEIDRLEVRLQKSPEKREAQRTLAREMTKLVHGEDELAKVESASQALFDPDAIKNLSIDEFLTATGEAPRIQVDQARFTAGISLIDAAVETGLAVSRGQAKKDIIAGGFYVNNQRVTDEKLVFEPAHLIAGKALLLRKGKKNYAVVLIT